METFNAWTVDKLFLCATKVVGELLSRTTVEKTVPRIYYREAIWGLREWTARERQTELVPLNLLVRQSSSSSYPPTTELRQFAFNPVISVIGNPDNGQTTTEVLSAICSWCANRSLSWSQLLVCFVILIFCLNFQLTSLKEKGFWLLSAVHTYPWKSLAAAVMVVVVVCRMDASLAK